MSRDITSFKDSLEKNVVSFNSTTTLTEQIAYSALTGLLGYLLYAPYGAVAGAVVYYILNITRYAKAFWAVVLAMWTYRQQQTVGIVFALVAAYIYIRA